MPKNNSSYYSDNSVFYKMIMVRFYNNNYYKKDYLTWNIDLDNYKFEMYAVKNGNEVTEILTSTPIKELPVLKETKDNFNEFSHLNSSLLEELKNDDSFYVCYLEGTTKNEVAKTLYELKQKDILESYCETFNLLYLEQRKKISKALQEKIENNNELKHTLENPDLIIKEFLKTR